MFREEDWIKQLRALTKKVSEDAKDLGGLLAESRKVIKQFNKFNKRNRRKKDWDLDDIEEFNEYIVNAMVLVERLPEQILKLAHIINPRIKVPVPHC